mmetsp:Transcript_293/g.407  ORF Transcript_293/g.407 Transcript_293/m.407 type:complete len:223 (+) Transcript_293:724-1392(+)
MMTTMAARTTTMRPWHCRHRRSCPRLVSLRLNRVRSAKVTAMHQRASQHRRRSPRRPLYRAHPPPPRVNPNHRVALPKTRRATTNQRKPCLSADRSRCRLHNSHKPSTPCANNKPERTPATQAHRQHRHLAPLPQAKSSRRVLLSPRLPSIQRRRARLRWLRRPIVLLANLAKVLVCFPNYVVITNKTKKMKRMKNMIPLDMNRLHHHRHHQPTTRSQKDVI